MMLQHPFHAEALGHGPADRRLAILREIGRVGSISQAAREVGVSYKAAWQALDTLTNLAGVPLVERAVGGSGGGGTHLTAAGHDLLAAAGAMHAARAQVAAGWQPGSTRTAALALAVRTSMRNQWPCTVQQLQRSGPLVRVQLQALSQAVQEAGGSAPQLLWARVTRESAELLALEPGVAVQALCKATAVRVLPASATAAEGAGNQWHGQVTRVARGALGDEVAAQLPGGLTLVGFADAGSGLRARSRVLLVAEESAVALAAS
ncbi:molybdate transport system regulatory protein [Oryzisolibacter propanilivorax]|uniref:Molybdate transport system regulatory protein n=1 Tax=Oryzisolibacter propanilivorax TaxID=1527607 RepID=A0A1G9THK1_9BURK|nr:TOBE domain-containing protein [Oryzisolibacter propanilivorax]SDM47207.1 molybdate transport system regulatory protein [Oryzisolibacter propanilivorax]